MAVPSYHREAKECKIRELQEGDASYTVEGVVAWGAGDTITCNSTYGSVDLKQDCGVDDGTASVQLKIWGRTIFEKFTQPFYLYKITNLKYGSFRDEFSLNTTRNTCVTCLGPAPAGFDRRILNVLLKRVGNLVDVKVAGFTSVKPIRKFFKCTQCEAEVEMPASVPKLIVCPKTSCGDMMRTANLKPHCGTVVTFMNEGKKVTAYVSGDVLAGVVDIDIDTESIRMKLMEYDSIDVGYDPKTNRITSLTVGMITLQTF